jgi:hypothetical protein
MNIKLRENFYIQHSCEFNLIMITDDNIQKVTLSHHSNGLDNQKMKQAKNDTKS